MEKRKEHYDKLIRVIKSCKNRNHLKTAVKAANHFMEMYKVLETDIEYQTAKKLIGLMKVKCKVGNSEDHVTEDISKEFKVELGLSGVPELQSIKVESEEIEGGVADDKTPKDLAKKHKRTLRDIADEINIGKEVEGEHTKSKKKAKEIAMDHVSEFPEYYSHEEHGVLASEKAMEDEIEESTTAGSSGAFTGLFNGGGKTPIKRTIHKSDVPVTVNGLTKPIGKMNSFRKTESKVFKKNQLKESNVITKKEMLESTDGGSFTPYDSPAGWGNNEFMGTKGKKGNAVQKKGAVPKTWDYDTGSSTYVKVKEKCKKFPYCVQDSNAIETSDTPFKESEENEKLIESICKKTGKSKKYVHSLINRYL